MSGKSCTNCGSSELEQDSARGDVVCTRCGSVLEDNCIVAEVQYEEGSHGGAHIVGQMVTDGGFKGLTVGGIIGSGKESRQVTLDNAKRKIKAVGAQLRLNNNCIDMAFNFYKKALQKRLTHGRKHTHVVAACIYITCRIEGTSHMLLDLSDVMQVNVYELGRTYLKLSSSLYLNIPAIDPCVYICRFAERLDLGEKRHEIEMTAMRIVQRMKQDWMHFGRRPSGLCGAALVVASRYYDTSCAVKEIVKIAKVCEATIRKRLSEFGDTPTSKLTLDEFMSVDLEGEEDPPCYKAARKKTKILFEQGLLDAVEDEVTKLQEVIDQELDKTRTKPRGPWAKYMSSTSESEVSTKDSSLDESEIEAQFVVTHTIDSIAEIINEVPVNADAALRPTASSLGLNESFGLTLSENDITDSVLELSVGVSQAINDEDGELKFDDIDDDEIDSYILKPHEADTKTVHWERLNADWLHEMAEKAKRREEEEAERREKEAHGELPPKKKRKTKKKVAIQANSAGEAIEKMLQEKRISNKINYDVLKQLTKPCLASAVTVTTEDITTHTVVESTPVKRLPSIRNPVNIPARVRLPKRSPSCLLASAPSGVETKSVKEPDCMREEETSHTPAAEVNIIPEAVEEDYEEDDYEQDDEVAVPEEHAMSITQLMSDRTGVGYEDDYSMADEYEEEY
ncbi:Transcription factor IIIB 90 kDa subunit [Halotydeus destructor]|nr:Transcription factor IIIB 90 kDa subunit [Halotydeus destructor]